ncbi:hypothetical protein [Jiangella anatolica]|nr:hypothetical protein [Jiangella anatolica]
MLTASAEENQGRWFGPADFEIGAEPRDPATVGRAVRTALGHAR